MKRDTVKTLAGLVVIAVIVVATFLYGNAQRQAQLNRDNAKKQQTASASPQASTSASASPTPATSGTPSSNTAPVQSPTGNSLQGTGGSGTQQPGQVAGSQATPTPSASPAPSATPTASPAPLPETGAPMAGLVGVTAIGVMAMAVRRSKRAIFAAARTRR